MEGAEPSGPRRARIGVVGHRRLPDPEELALCVDEALDAHVPRLFEPAGTGPVVYTVLTSLAEGADRLVADMVLKRPDAALEVVLPLAVEDYVEDFRAEESRAEFERLHALACRTISLRATRLAAEFPPGELAEARERAYEDAGRYLVRNSGVLLALWDGGVTRGRGGTAATVRYAQSIGHPVVVVSTKERGRIEVLATDVAHNRLSSGSP